MPRASPACTRRRSSDISRVPLLAAMARWRASPERRAVSQRSAKRAAVRKSTRDTGRTERDSPASRVKAVRTSARWPGASWPVRNLECESSREFGHDPVAHRERPFALAGLVGAQIIVERSVPQREEKPKILGSADSSMALGACPGTNGRPRPGRPGRSGRSEVPRSAPSPTPRPRARRHARRARPLRVEPLPRRPASPPARRAPPASCTGKRRC